MSKIKFVVCVCPAIVGCMDASFTQAFVHEGIPHCGGRCCAPCCQSGCVLPSRSDVNRDGMEDVHDVATESRSLLPRL
ncbi:MAG: hypothetical protein KBT12_09325 [Bacteroidales bacterium]|nr:hypothetical protein [Candidatus Physcousia equi]